MHDARLFIELGGVVFGLGVLGRLASSIGLSPIPLYLLAGLAFGRGGLVPLVTAGSFIEKGASIGVVLLLLVLGLEYSSTELVTNLRAHAWSGGVDLVVNAAPGAVAGWLLGWGPVATMALAGITAVSSSGIISKVITDQGRLGNRETPTVLSILVLEDLAMAVFLPVLTGLLAQKTFANTVISVSLALGALAIVLAASLRFGPTISRWIFSPNDEVLLLRVLGLSLLVAGVAEELQVSAAVGAFLVGIALSGKVADSARIVLTPLRDLFAAVFFVFFGLQTAPASLAGVLVPAIALGGVGVFTKGLTGWLAARRVGIAMPGRIRAGTSLIARGEFSIVIAGLTLSAGVQPRLASLAAAYVIVLAIVGPIAARLSDPIGRSVARARRRAAPTLR